MLKKINFYTALLVLMVVFSSCSKYQKVLKSTDTNLKYEKALEYYEEKDYVRAMTLFQSILPFVKGTERGEEVSFYYAQCHYGSKDYLLAGYYFKQFGKTYRNSTHAEEAHFMSAYCSYLISPRPDLDQEDTYTAIKGFEYFLRKYPDSPRVAESNKLIDEMKMKLSEKEFNSAKLYYHVRRYKAASVSLHNCLRNFPDSKYRENILVLIVKADFDYAENSISQKQEERYEATIKDYYTFIEEFPKSEQLKEVEKIYDRSLQKLNELKSTKIN